MESVTRITQVWSGAILVSFGGGMVGMILWLMHVVVVGWWMVKPWKRFLCAQYHWKSITEMYIASPLCALAFGYFVFPCNRCNKEHFELELELELLLRVALRITKGPRYVIIFFFWVISMISCSNMLTQAAHLHNNSHVNVITWISNFIPHFTEHVITYPCWD